MQITTYHIQSLTDQIDDLEMVIEDELEEMETLTQDYLDAYEESPACWEDDYLDDEEYDEDIWDDTDEEFLSGDPDCQLTSIGGPEGSYKLCEPYDGLTCKSMDVDYEVHGPEAWCYGWDDTDTGEPAESVPPGPRWRRVRI